MIRQIDKVLSDALIKAGIFTSADMQKFLLDVQSSKENLNEYLIKRSLATREQILKILSDSLKIDIVNLKTTAIDKKVIEKVPIKFAWFYKFMPVKMEGKTVTLAVSYPFDVKTQDEIRVFLGLDPKIVLASESDIVESLKKYYGLAADTIDRILNKEQDGETAYDVKEDQNVEDLERKSEDASVIKLVNQIILEAFQRRATDIHIEPYRNKVRFRYRIDGILLDANLPAEAKRFLLPILSRIKIMSNLSIVEKRLPQDGSAVVRTKDQTLDLRISTIPTSHGESMVIRILPTKVMLFSLEKLGLHPNNVQVFRDIIKKPHGIVFVTGPTGSGKTTTLYACLNEINSLERKIITIEDPIEYEMENITQIQVNPKVHLTFAAGLRSILRHDPDIIMVGEVRDLETGEIAIRTALTGHLVFSTLHTNDAASGVTRLIDMGVESYLVASSVEAFVAQRLVRVICPHCKVESRNLEIKEEIQTALHIKNIDDIKIFQGKGCDQCNNTGYYGRTAIHEVLVVNEEIRAAILEKPRADHIKNIAMRQGMLTLRQDGWKKVIEGITTTTEVLNVTSKEEYPKDAIFSFETKIPAYPADKPAKDNVEKSPKATPVQTQKRLRVISKDVLAATNEYDSRTYPRIRESVKIRYKIFREETSDGYAMTVHEDDIHFSAVTKDISAGGLLFANEEIISEGTILDLSIEVGHVVDCLARVCRVEKDESGKIFNVAAYYLDMASADRVIVNDFVKSRLK